MVRPPRDTGQCYFFNIETNDGSISSLVKTHESPWADLVQNRVTKPNPNIHKLRLKLCANAATFFQNLVELRRSYYTLRILLNSTHDQQPIQSAITSKQAPLPDHSRVTEIKRSLPREVPPRRQTWFTDSSDHADRGQTNGKNRERATRGKKSSLNRSCKNPGSPVT